SAAIRGAGGHSVPDLQRRRPGPRPRAPRPRGPDRVPGPRRTSWISQHMNFASDNTAPVLPEVMAAIEAINRGRVASYGADAETQRLQALACEVFETDLAIFPVATGT